MVDPFSTSCAIITLVTFAFSTALTLSETIKDFKGHNSKTRALQKELEDLTKVLKALLETINENPEINFDNLRSLLSRCGKACGEHGKLIARFTRHSDQSHTSIRDWFKRKSLQGDITDFKQTLAGYKSTISIALANVNM